MFREGGGTRARLVGLEAEETGETDLFVERLDTVEERRRRLRGERSGDGTYSSSVASRSLSPSAS